jgi:hypothetical protein
MTQKYTLKDLSICAETLGSDVELVDYLYDCECEDDYIRYFEPPEINSCTGYEKVCARCGAIFDDVPNSRRNEVIDYLEKLVENYSVLIDEVGCFSISDLKHEQWCIRQINRLKSGITT